jgi:hypothetical protein
MYDFATAPLWISLYMRKTLFSFLSVHQLVGLNTSFKRSLNTGSLLACDVPFILPCGASLSGPPVQGSRTLVFKPRGNNCKTVPHLSP